MLTFYLISRKNKLRELQREGFNLFPLILIKQKLLENPMNISYYLSCFPLPLSLLNRHPSCLSLSATLCLSFSLSFFPSPHTPLFFFLFLLCLSISSSFTPFHSFFPLWNSLYSCLLVLLFLFSHAFHSLCPNGTRQRD